MGSGTREIEPADRGPREPARLHEMTYMTEYNARSIALPGRTSHEVRDLVQFRYDRVPSLSFDTPVCIQQVASFVRQQGTAAPASPVRSGDDRRAELALKVGNEQPRAAIGHLHLARRRGDGAESVDALEKIRSTGTEQTRAVTEYAKKQAGLVSGHQRASSAAAMRMSSADASC